MNAVLKRIRSKPRRLMPIVAAVVLLLGSAVAVNVTTAKPAAAATTLCSDFTPCTTSPYTDHGWQPNISTSYWGQASGDNCTNYVAYYEQHVNGLSSSRPSWITTGTSGGAHTWWQDAFNGHISEGQTPVVGAIAWWGKFGWNGSSGHVGIVEDVSNNGGTIEVSWDSYSAGPYKWVQLNSTNSNTDTAVGWPQGFIYLGVSGASPSPSPSPSPTPPPNVKTHLVGKLNNDNKADAMFIDTRVGNVYVSLGQSNGTFGASYGWGTGITPTNADKYALADVNGDGLDDLVAYFATLGRAYVSLSSGAGFYPFVQWGNFGSTYAGSTNELLGVVDSSGQAALVLYYADVDRFYVATSTGSAFNTPTLWGDYGSTYQGSSQQLLGDVNGDGYQDIVLYYGGSVARTYVALSSGSGFGTPSLWGDYGSYLGSKQQLLGDVNGDGHADLILHFDDGSTYSRWYVALAGTSSFGSMYGWGDDGSTYSNSDRQFMADVDGNSKADKVFAYTGSGNWYVSTTSGSGFNTPVIAATNFGYTTPS